MELLSTVHSAPSALIAALLLAGPAAAADAENCASNTPAVSIPACTRIIAQARKEADKQYAEAFANRGKAHMLAGQSGRAIADLDEALRREPSHGDARHNRGVVYFQLGKNEKALADFNEVVRLYPNVAKSVFARGRTYHAMGQIDRAIADFSTTLSIDPRHVDALISRGAVFSVKAPI